MAEHDPITEPRARTVALGDGRTVSVRELSLRKLSALAEAVRELVTDPEVRGKLSSGDNGQVMEAVLGLVAKGTDKLAEAIELATDLPKGQALDLTPSQAIDVLLIVWEVNDLAGLFKKKLPALMPATATG